MSAESTHVIVHAFLSIRYMYPHNTSNRNVLRTTLFHTHSEHPNYDALLPALITHGVNTLSDHCPLTPGIPLKPMLAHPTKGIQEVLKRFEGAEFTCEWKYDGERAQIHVLGEGRGVKVYSRNSENNTSKYPDIIARMSKVCGIDNATST